MAGSGEWLLASMMILNDLGFELKTIPKRKCMLGDLYKVVRCGQYWWGHQDESNMTHTEQGDLDGCPDLLSYSPGKSNNSENSESQDIT